MRPDWDHTWMAVADVMSARSLCDGRQVGAVVVDRDQRPVSTGYNGPPAGLDLADGRTCQVWCPRMLQDDRGTSYDNCFTIHAEANALMFADRRNYEGGTLFVTSACCWGCGKMVSNSGIARVVMKLSPNDAHRDPQRTIQLMRDSGLTVDVWETQ